MRGPTFLIAALGYALAIVIGGVWAVEHFTSPTTRRALPDAPIDASREALRVPPHSAGPPVQFRWSDLKRMEVHRGLKYLSAVLGMPLDMTAQWQQLTDRFDSHEPLRYDELRFVLERMRSLTMRACQRMWHEQDGARRPPPREDRFFERNLTAESAQWTAPIPADGAPRDLRFESYTLTNIGDAPVRDVRLRVNGHPRWHTIQELVADAVPSEGTDRDKAMKLYEFFLENRFHWSAHGGAEMHDPVKLFNVWGGGICDDVSQCFVRMARQAGLRARVWALEGHQVPEAFFDGAWHVLDVDLGTYFPMADGRALAGVAELADPANVGILQRAYRDHATPRQVRTYTRAFQTTGDDQTVSVVSTPWHRIHVDLLPGQRVAWRRANAGRFFSSLMAYRPMQYSNLVTDWNVTASRAALQSCRLDGLQVADGAEGATVTAAGERGTLIVPFSSSYPLVGGSLAYTVARGGRSGVTVSVKPGRRPWLELTPAAFRRRANNQLVCEDLSPLLAIANGKPDYRMQVRLTLKQAVRISGLRLRMVGQLATVSLPRLVAGENRFEWTSSTANPTVKLRFSWSEGPPVQALSPPPAPLEPAMNTEVPPGKDLKLRWPAPQADGVSYQVRVYLHPQSAYPIVPHRNRQLGRPDCVLAGGWLSPNRTIGWEVRSRQHAGPWSRWSRRFTFRTAPGP